MGHRKQGVSHRAHGAVGTPFLTASSLRKDRSGERRWEGVEFGAEEKALKMATNQLFTRFVRAS